MARDKNGKSPLIEILLCVFLGFLGTHRFYTGKRKTAILFCFTFGLFGLGTLFDLIFIIYQNVKNSTLRKLIKILGAIVFYFAFALFLAVLFTFFPGAYVISPDGTSVFSPFWSLVVVLLPLVTLVLLLAIENWKSKKSHFCPTESISKTEKTEPGLSSHIPCPERNPTFSTQPPLKIPSDRYVVLDIETTGFSRVTGRIIEIAVDSYAGGKRVAQFHTYVNPEIPVPENITKLTGITDSDVSSAPKILQIKQPLLDFIRDAPIVGHNIKSFDILFLQTRLGVTIPNQLFDTLTMAKEAFPGLPSYKLTYLDQFLHLGGAEHHRASNDIEITNRLFLACQNPKRYRHDASTQCPLTISTVPRSLTGLTDKTICFTGEISIPREKARQMAAEAGAILKNNVSRKLDYLVVGIQDCRLVGETGQSNAQRYAAELIEKRNTRLQIIDESRFYQLLGPISTEHLLHK